MSEKNTPLDIVIYIVLALIFISWISNSGSDSSYDGCYDADPTQWTDMVCE
jgi:hypothetical protein